MLTVLSRVIKTTAEASKYLGGFETGMTQSLVRLGEFLANMKNKEHEVGETAAPSETSDREIVISRVFDAPRELVWDAMTDPKKVVKWVGAARLHNDDRGDERETGRHLEARHARTRRH